MEGKDNTCWCSICPKKFTLRKNLYAHLRKCHQIEPCAKTESAPPAFECESCNKYFYCQSSLTRHINRNHAFKNEHVYSQGTTRKNRLICPHDTCDEQILNYKSLNKHLSEEHNIDVECEDLRFNSMEDFEKWKNQIQQKTMSSYSVDTATKQLTSGVYRRYFNCHRSYKYKSKGTNMRAIKSMGSNKIGKACPSRLEVTIMQNDEESTVSVKFWKTHCGHTEQVEKITLNKDVRLKIAEKLKKGASFDHVLNSFRNSGENDDNHNRSLLLKRKDLHNIVRDFNIDYDTKHQKKDVIARKKIKDNLKPKNNEYLVNKTELILSLINTVPVCNESMPLIEKHLDIVIETLKKEINMSIDLIKPKEEVLGL